MNKKDTIIVGLSGGVDSSVAAHLLTNDYDVQGIFMKNWDSENSDDCTVEQDFNDATSVATQIGIPISSINFVREYWHNVFQICLNEFANGNTPNPDILCNKEIKFKCFLNYALEHKAVKIATGHYARIDHNNGHYQLLKAKDDQKDQTYFLYRLNQQQLAHCVFPLGDMLKSQVRALAAKNNFINAAKKDSTGICFIGAKKFKPFLSQYFLAQPGDIITDKNQVIGQHDGLMFYTLGQRKGLGLGGIANFAELPWYVIGKDLSNNCLIVGQSHDHPALVHSSLICNDVHWISGQPPNQPLNCHAKIRYQQTDSPCTLHQHEDQSLKVVFTTPQWAITPGQSIVFYQDDICLGGAIIVKPVRE